MITPKHLHDANILARRILWLKAQAASLPDSTLSCLIEIAGAPWNIPIPQPTCCAAGFGSGSPTRSTIPRPSCAPPGLIQKASGRNDERDGTPHNFGN